MQAVPSPMPSQTKMGSSTTSSFGEMTRAGEVVDIAPGHDAWVVGEQPAVTIDFQGVLGWAEAPERGERVLTTLLFTDIVG